MIPLRLVPQLLEFYTRNGLTVTDVHIARDQGPLPQDIYDLLSRYPIERSVEVTDGMVLVRHAPITNLAEVLWWASHDRPAGPRICGELPHLTWPHETLGNRLQKLTDRLNRARDLAAELVPIAPSPSAGGLSLLDLTKDL